VEVSFRRPDGQMCSGYLAEPGARRNGRAIVILHEIWGVAAPVRGIADRCAAEGYRTLVPDLFRGKLARELEEGLELMSKLDFQAAVEQDLRGAAIWLGAALGRTSSVPPTPSASSYAPIGVNGHAKLASASVPAVSSAAVSSAAVPSGVPASTRSPDARIACMGFCMGGALAVLAATKVQEIDAAVCFYGIPPAESADPAKIEVPFLGHFAQNDDWCTPQKVDALEQRLRAGAVDHRIYRYQAAHAFMNRDGDGYSEAATQLAWRRTLDFLDRTLV
jgi:carboxymethylenebutenolidase